ncbi:MAG: ATP-binding protein [Nitrospira sp.]|nr:ATP-binding protein [Nitrospira sp.]
MEMSSFKRAQISTLLSRLREDPKWLIVVAGPRQVGKTTLVRQALAQIDLPHKYLPVDRPQSTTLETPWSSLVGTWEDQDYPWDSSTTLPSDDPEEAVPISDVRDTAWLIRQWERARREAKQSERRFVLVFDEIQKIPNWSETVKGLWDADRHEDLPLHVVVLGSAPLLMQRGLSESMLGRFETIRLPHWSFTEMSEAFGFDLDRYIYFGGYPGAASLVQEQQRWREYILGSIIEPNIERDILAMERVDRPALLKRLFEFGAEMSGQILAYDKMLGQIQDVGNTTTLSRYLDLLSKAGLLTGLGKYAGGVYRRRASSPKLNVLNTALMSVHSGYTFEEARADRSFWGRLVESAVGAHLFNTGTPEVRLHYWRERSLEVDFVLEYGRKLVAVEVKSGPRRGNTSGMEEFKTRFSPKSSLLVGEGGTPISEFLSAPAMDWFKQS